MSEVVENAEILNPERPEVIVVDARLMVTLGVLVGKKLVQKLSATGEGGIEVLPDPENDDAFIQANRWIWDQVAARQQQLEEQQARQLEASTKEEEPDPKNVVRAPVHRRRS